MDHKRPETIYIVHITINDYLMGDSEQIVIRNEKQPRNRYLKPLHEITSIEDGIGLACQEGLTPFVLEEKHKRTDSGKMSWGMPTPVYEYNKKIWEFMRSLQNKKPRGAAKLMRNGICLQTL